MEAMKETLFHNELRDDDINELEQISLEMFKSTTALESLTSLHVQMVETGLVNRSSATTLKTLTTGMEGFDDHFKQYPISSYTAIPTKTNYSVTLEGLLGNIARAVIGAIKSLFKFIITSVKNLIMLRRRNDANIVKVQTELNKDLKELKSKALRPNRLSELEMLDKMQLVARAMPPMGRYMSGLSQGSELEIKYGSSINLLQRIVSVEQTTINECDSHLSILSDKLPQKLRRIDSSVDQQDLVEQIKLLSKPTKPLSILLTSVTTPDLNLDFGYSLRTQSETNLRGIQGIKDLNYNPQNDFSTFEELGVAMSRVHDHVSAQGSATIKFQPTKKYDELYNAISVLEKNINVYLNVPQGTLQQEVNAALLELVKDIKNIASALMDTESLCNQYRIGTASVLRLIKSYKMLAS